MANEEVPGHPDQGWQYKAPKQDIKKIFSDQNIPAKARIYWELVNGGDHAKARTYYLDEIKKKFDQALINLMQLRDTRQKAFGRDIPEPSMQAG